VRVNLDTGQRAQPGDARVILEAFRPGTEPSESYSVIEGISNYGEDAGYGSIIPLGAADSRNNDSTVEVGGSGIVTGIVTGEPAGGVDADTGMSNSTLEGITSGDTGTLGNQSPGVDGSGSGTLNGAGTTGTDSRTKSSGGTSSGDSDSGLY